MNLVNNEEFNNSIKFLDNILFLDTFEEVDKIYNMIIFYHKNEYGYTLKLIIKSNDISIIETKCSIDTKLNGSKVINEIIELITKKYNNDLIIDLKEYNINNKCIKYGRKKYNKKKV